MKKISTLLWALGVLPLSSIAVQGALNQLDAEVLYSNDVLLNTQDGLNKIAMDRNLQNLLYSRVNMMNKSDHENWYQHSEFGKFILSLAGQEWLSTEFGKEWVEKQQWVDWLQQNAKNTWVFNNAAITWLNSNAALNWVKTDLGKKQFSGLMAHCHQYDKAHSVYTSDCEVLKKTKAGDGYYRKGKPTLTNGDDLSVFIPGGDINLQNQGYTDSGFQDRDFGNSDNPLFDHFNSAYPSSPYHPDIFNSGDLAIAGGTVTAATALAAAGGVALYNRLQNTSTVVDESENEVVRELRQCVEVGNTLACPLEREADTRTLMRDVERQWDIQVNNQPLHSILLDQLQGGIDQQYNLGRMMTSDNLSEAITAIYNQAQRDHLARAQLVVEDGFPVRVINIAGRSDAYGRLSQANAVTFMQSHIHGLTENQTLLFPILRNAHFYLITVHRQGDEDQVLIFDSAAINDENSALVRALANNLRNNSHRRVNVLAYSRGIQAANDCGFYVTYMIHRLVSNGFERTINDLGLVNGFTDNVFGATQGSTSILDRLKVVVENYLLKPSSTEYLARYTRSVWLRNYFSQLYQLRNINEGHDLNIVEVSFLNNIPRGHNLDDIASLELLAYQAHGAPYSNGARNDAVLGNTLLQSIEHAQSRALSDGERRLILESHQGVTAALTNSFIEKTQQRGIDVGLDAINKKVTANVILDKNNAQDSYIRLSLEIPVKSVESEAIVGKLKASANISIEVAKKMTKGKQQRKSKNQGYVVPYKLVYKNITMEFAKSDVVSL